MSRKKIKIKDIVDLSTITNKDDLIKHFVEPTSDKESFAEFLRNKILNRGK